MTTESYELQLIGQHGNHQYTVLFMASPKEAENKPMSQSAQAATNPDGSSPPRDGLWSGSTEGKNKNLR